MRSGNAGEISTQYHHLAERYRRQYAVSCGDRVWTGEFNICLPFSMIEPPRELLVNPPLEKLRAMKIRTGVITVRRPAPKPELVATLPIFRYVFPDFEAENPAMYCRLKTRPHYCSCGTAFRYSTSQYGTVNGQYALRVEHLINPILNSPGMRNSPNGVT